MTVQHRLFDPYAVDRAVDDRRRRRLPVTDQEQLVLELVHAAGGVVTGRVLLRLVLDAGMTTDQAGDAVASLAARRAITTEGDLVRLAA
ncbi:MAG: hypothetical protein ACLGIR_13560 [Actinomycetes bacterium]